MELIIKEPTQMGSLRRLFPVLFYEIVIIRELLSPVLQTLALIHYSARMNQTRYSNRALSNQGIGHL